jgi:hypothetical protein
MVVSMRQTPAQADSGSAADDTLGFPERDNLGKDLASLAIAAEPIRLATGLTGDYRIFS